MVLWPSLLAEALFGFDLTVLPVPGLYKVFFPAALTLAHLALAAAANLALTEGLLRRSFEQPRKLNFFNATL